MRRDITDAPTALPLHDIICTDLSELVHSTPIFGAATESGAGAGGSVLTGTGDAASWLRMAALMDARVDGLITDYPDRLRAVMAERGLELPKPVRYRRCLRSLDA